MLLHSIVTDVLKLIFFIAFIPFVTKFCPLAQVNKKLKLKTFITLIKNNKCAITESTIINT